MIQMSFLKVMRNSCCQSHISLVFGSRYSVKHACVHYSHCMCFLFGGDGWQQPSLLLRHDSVDSGVAKGGHGGLAGSSCWKDTPTWHGAPRGVQDSHHHQGRHPKRGAVDRDRQVGHRQRNGNFHPRKGTPYQDKFPNEERKDSKDDKLKFVEEDFVSR